MKAIIAVLVLVLVLQTAFILSQGQSETAPRNLSPSDNNTITTELKRLSTDISALKTRVSVLEKGTATPTPPHTPTSTPTLTSTSISTPYFVVKAERANVREGPEPSYPVITTVGQGERFDVDARNPSGTWLEFCCVKEQRGWIYEPLVEVSVDVFTLPIADNIFPDPTPTDTPTPTSPLPPGCGPHDPHGPDLDCGDFSTHREAQACFIAAGGPDRDPHRLDGDRNGLACERLP